MRRRRDEDVEELEELDRRAEPETAATEQAPDAAGGPAARVLELQKSAGNRATTAALSRWPVFGAQQVAQWPKEHQLILDGTVVPLESFQEQQRSTSSAAGAPSRDGGTGPGEIVVTIKQGKWSADLFRQSLSGSGYKTVELVVPGKDGKGIRIILRDVLISSYSVSDADGRGDAPLESLSLSFRKREFSQDPPPPRR